MATAAEIKLILTATAAGFQEGLANAQKAVGQTAAKVTEAQAAMKAGEKPLTMGATPEAVAQVQTNIASMQGSIAQGETNVMGALNRLQGGFTKIAIGIGGIAAAFIGAGLPMKGFNDTMDQLAGKFPDIAGHADEIKANIQAISDETDVPFSQLLSRFAGLVESTGSADGALAKLRDTTANATDPMTQMQKAFGDVAMTISERLAPMFTALAGWIDRNKEAVTTLMMVLGAAGLLLLLSKVVIGIGQGVKAFGELVRWLRNARVAQTLFNAILNPASVLIMAAATAAAIGVIAMTDHAEASMNAANAAGKAGDASGRNANLTYEEVEAERQATEVSEKLAAVDEEMIFIRLRAEKGMITEREAILENIEAIKEKIRVQESAGKLALDDELKLAGEQKKLKENDERDREKAFNLAQKQREVAFAERKAAGDISRKGELQAELEFLQAELAFHADNAEKVLDIRKQIADKRGEIRKAEADEEKKLFEAQKNQLEELDKGFEKFANERLAELNRRRDMEKQRVEDEGRILEGGVDKQLAAIEKLKVSDEQKQKMRMETLRKYANDARLSEEGRAKIREQLAEEAAKTEEKWEEWRKDRQEKATTERGRQLQKSEEFIEQLKKEGRISDEGYAEEKRKLEVEKAEEAINAAGQAFQNGRRLEQSDAQAHVDNLKEILAKDKEFGTLTKQGRENINKFLKKTTGSTGDELLEADKKAKEDELANAGKVAEEKFAAEKAANDAKIAAEEAAIAKQKELAEAIKNAPIAAQPYWEELFAAIERGAGRAGEALKKNMIAPGIGGPRAAGAVSPLGVGGGGVANDINIVQNFYGDQNPLEFRRHMDDTSRALADKIVETVGGYP